MSKRKVSLVYAGFRRGREFQSCNQNEEKLRASTIASYKLAYFFFLLKYGEERREKERACFYARVNLAGDPKEVNEIEELKKERGG